MKKTTFENKKVRVTFCKNEKRAIEIYPNDTYVDCNDDHTVLFECSLVEISKKSISLHINNYTEDLTIQKQYATEEEALQYFDPSDITFRGSKATYEVKGKLRRTFNTQVLYPTSSIRSVMIHHAVCNQSFQKK